MNSAVGKMFLSNEHVVKVVSEDELTVSGYDLLTEAFVCINKNCLLPVPNSVYKLLGNEQAKIHLVDSVCKTKRQMSKILGVSERTVFRMVKQHLAE